MSMSLLARTPVTWDSDASTYLTAVESADGQSLENGVARSINQLVIDLKTRNLWNSIKSSCLLCAARTQNGAVVPLKGVAPTLTSFIGDYNRETGLRRTSGTFNINRNNNADPQNNKHLAVFPTSIDCRNNGSGVKGLIAASTSSSFIYNDSTGGRIFLRANAQSNVFGSDLVNSNNLIGVSVNSSTNTSIIFNNKIQSINISTTSPPDVEFSLYTGGGLTASTSRIAYYSVGESLNLNLLQQTLNKFMFNMKSVVLSGYSTNNEANDWINRVNSNGGSVSGLTRLAIHWFCNQIDSNNLRDRFYRLNLFCGDNLNSVLVPLYRGQSINGTQYGNLIDANNNFSNSNYDATKGLSGNGVNTWLDTGLPQNYANDRFFAVTGYFFDGSYNSCLGCRPTTANSNNSCTLSGDGGINYLSSAVYDSAGLMSGTQGGALRYSPQSLCLINTSPSFTDQFYYGTQYVNGEYITYSTFGGRNTTDTTTFAIFATKVGSSSFERPRVCILSSYSFGIYVNTSQVIILNNVFSIFNAMIGR